MRSNESLLSETWPDIDDENTAADFNRKFTPRKAFEFLWFFTVPVTSVVVLTSVKGTTPAAILGLLSFVLAVFFFKNGVARYYKLVACFTVVFACSLVASYIASTMNPPPLGMVTVVQQEGASLGLRMSTITQSIYLAAAASVFFWCFCFRSRAIETGFAWGMWFLITIGWIEWIGFLMTGSNMDFLSNRTFGETMEHSGSLFQTANILGVAVQRFKSLTGEPSMFALVALPSVPYFFSKGRRFLAIACIASLLATFSTTAYLGLGLIAFIFVLRNGARYWPYVLVILTLLGGLAMATDQVQPIFDEMFSSKLEGSSESGKERQASFERTLKYAGQASPAVIAAGAGFGVAREYSLLCSLFINTGLIGVLTFCFLLIAPAAILILRGRDNLGLGLGLVSIFACFALSVPEFSYPSSWLFLGLAWRKILESKLQGYASN